MRALTAGLLYGPTRIEGVREFAARTGALASRAAQLGGLTVVSRRLWPPRACTRATICALVGCTLDGMRISESRRVRGLGIQQQSRLLERFALQG
ncbi:hypothetical protein [Streptomyces sp. NPDC007856]|uniref:hypothetical protein n=1 Tax=Streptomyces sp. NPDC007856 TaxID=3364781 RepID=UPI0036B9BAD7